MEDFLVSSSAAAKTGFRGNQRVHVVLGSESCDLDSAVSSVAMAYFLSRSSSGLPGCSLVLPVLNVPRSLFPLRRDVVLLLRESGVATETLVFRDEVDLHRLHANRRLALTLVDVRNLQSADGVLQTAVVDIIDPEPHASRPVPMEKVASCATMVTERILSRAPEILDRQLAMLLYGVMVGDRVGGGTVRDGQMIRLLRTRFPELPHGGALHAALHAAKFDLSGLSTEQILLQDVAVAAGGDVRVAVSNVYMSLKVFLGRTNLQQDLCAACHSRRLDALVAMMTSFSDQSEEPIRQLAVYSSNTQHRHEISHALWSSRSPALCLSPVSSPYKDILAFEQGNSRASRRQLLPVLAHFLSDCSRTDSDDPMTSPAADHPPHVFSVSRHHRRRLQLGEESPPAPRNSLVDGCPLDGGFNQEALLEKFSRMGEEEEQEEGEEQEEREEEKDE